MTSIVDHRRRNLIFGRSPETPTPNRPPWTREAALMQACTGCGACAKACPEEILVIGAGNLPQIDFECGECTFCGACAEACEEPVFAETRHKERAFAHSISISRNCLAVGNVFCRSCGDVCPESAIAFGTRLGGPGTPSVSADLCTGCGACIGVCPAGAISAQAEVN